MALLLTRFNPYTGTDLVDAYWAIDQLNVRKKAGERSIVIVAEAYPSRADKYAGVRPFAQVTINVPPADFAPYFSDLIAADPVRSAFACAYDYVKAKAAEFAAATDAAE